MNQRYGKGLSVSLIFCAAFSAAALSFAANRPASGAVSAGDKTLGLASYGKLPLSFEENRGQADASVKFLSQGNGYTLLLTPGAVELNLAQPQRNRRAALKMSFPGAQLSPVVTGDGKQSAVSSYFVGKDPSKWVSGAPNYARVRYQELYPGVDLVFYGNQRQLEYDLVVAPGADPKVIQMQFDGVDSMRLDGDGNLVLGTGDSEIRQHRPIVYQERDGVRQSIAGRYVIQAHHRVAFEVAQHDTRKPLIIDPVLSFATYLGSNGEDLFGLSATADSATYPAVAVDSLGNVYVTGFNGGLATDFPGHPVTLTGVASGGGTEVFVIKMNSTGTAVLYSVVFGGGQTDVGGGIAVDTSGNAYIAGYTSSTNFPVTAGAPQTAIHGATNAFVAKVNSGGTALSYSTYLGGSGSDWGRAIAVDHSGNAYVTGTAQESSGTNFPLVNALSSSPSAGFLSEVNAAGTAFVYSTFLSAGIGYGVTLDSSADAYVTGSTGSSTVPSPAQAYVLKVNALGSGIGYGPVLLGTSGAGLQSIGFGIALDTQGDAYVTGITNDLHFPVTSGAAQTTYGGGLSDAFAAKLGPTGTPIYATYIGGIGSNILPERGSGIGVDGSGYAYVAGTTQCIDFPVASPIAGALNGSPATLMKGSVSGSASTWSPTSLAGTFDQVTALAFDPVGGSHIYAGATAVNVTSGGGIYKSSDGGSTWTSATSGITSTSIDAIAVDPNTSTTVYAIAGGKIYQSTNSGTSWAVVGPAVGTAGSLAIAKTSPSTIYAGSSTGFFYTTNPGTLSSWNAISVPLPVRSLVVDPNNAQIAYAGTGSGVYKTTNAGGSWSAVNSGLPAGLVSSVAINSTSTMLYAATPDGLFYTSTGGTSWTQTGLTVLQIPSTPLLVAVDSGNNVYLAFEGGGLAVGTNGGTTSGEWSPLTYSGLSQNQILALGTEPGVSGTAFAGIVSATNAFLTRISPDGTSFSSSTCIGGSDNDLGQSIAVTAAGAVYLSGATISTNFPVTPGAVQASNAGLYDAFVVGISGTTGTGGGTTTATIQEPLSGTILDGTVTVSGWALDTGSGGTAISSVQVWIDGNFVADATYGVALNLCGTYPTAPGCANAGFTYQFASSTLTAGSHTISVIATDSSLPPNTGTAAVTVTIESQAVVPFNFDPSIGPGPDVIWEDPVTGFAQVWYLGGSQGISVLAAANLTLTNPWHIVGVGDFDGNGTPDVLWQDPVSGAVQIWYMGGPMGNVVMNAVNITNSNPWKVVSVADFNRDGHPDLLWEDPTSGFAQIWYMGGPLGITVENAANLTLTNPWHIVGSGDFNGDGLPDVLWQDPVTGTVQIWYMGGALGNVVQSAVNLTANPWHVVAIADFNLDGHPDVILQDPVSGSSQVFFYNGAQGTTLLTTATFSGANPWYIAGPH